MRKKTLWIVRTAVMTALLIILQAVTKPAGQFVTGSCVNLVLGVSVLTGGLWCGFTVALISPFFAFLLGVAAMPVLLVPGVAAGNVVLILALHLTVGRRGADGQKAPVRYAGAAAAAAAKFAVLWLLVVKVLLPLAGLPEAKVAVMTATFTWPQLVTALIGGCLAVTAAPLITKAAAAKG